MNWKHVEAVTAGDILRTCVIDGRPVVASSHFAFLCHGEIDTARAKKYPKLAEMWGKWGALPVIPAVDGGCVKSGSKIIHVIGRTLIAEHFFRCFDEGSMWSVTSVNEPACVYRDGALIGVVMPVRGDLAGEPKVTDPSDEDVFSSFASAANNWYLESDGGLAERVSDAEDGLGRARERAEEARTEVSGLWAELNSLRELTRARRAAK